ncbi:S8 family serine peptidase [uncultured Jatrophihabitans sp.]|uniref:S8 family serine peptidase n=1 Tax=uncultured Jatrophihabitans sp. TaxID=1610747 RepID=UPI0035CA980B
MSLFRGALAVLLAMSTAVVAVPSQRAEADPSDCTFKPGTAVGDIWPQRRLDFQQVWGITRGAGVKVAVVDSGVNFINPQLRGIRHETGVSVIPTFDRTTRDCVGHGTAVAGIIAARPLADQTFLGVAPDVTIIPIKQTNTKDDKSGQPAGIAAGIRAAISAGAQVINISVEVNAPTPDLTAAVAQARAKGRVIVAAAGNDGQQSRAKAYPAAYSTTFDNVIAVSATDSNDVVADFANAGGYVTVAAPGKDVPVPSSLSGYENAAGTSFAAPYVTGTVALMLAAAAQDPGTSPMTPADVRDRLEVTADAPPADVPDPLYGYGIVNPYLAVTTVRDGSVALPRPSKATPLPAPQAAKPADRALQHVALGLAFGLIGLTVLTLVAAGILRAGGRRRAGPLPPSEPDRDRGTLVRR